MTLALLMTLALPMTVTLPLTGALPMTRAGAQPTCARVRAPVREKRCRHSCRNAKFEVIQQPGGNFPLDPDDTDGVLTSQGKEVLGSTKPRMPWCARH